MGFLCGSDGKESAYNAGDLGSIPGGKDSMEKRMAIHSSICGWKIPWTEAPGGLQPTGVQTATNAGARAHTHGGGHTHTWWRTHTR